jgi:hypothetical protein
VNYKAAYLNKLHAAWSWWLTPVILATHEAEIQENLGLKPALGNSLREPISKINPSQKRVGGGHSKNVKVGFDYLLGNHSSI